MMIKLGGDKGFELEIRRGGVFIRLPWIGEAFVCFADKRLTAFNRIA